MSLLPLVPDGDARGRHLADRHGPQRGPAPAELHDRRRGRDRGVYVLIWMFNGKRSHSLIGVLTGVCAFYVPRFRRPSKPVLGVTALAGVLAVSLAIGWRGNQDYEHSLRRVLPVRHRVRPGEGPGEPEREGPAAR